MEELRDIESNNEGGLWLAWKNIHVTSVDGKKVLLQDIAGEVKGKFLAIMGPSGSGKTTLMNVLAQRTRNAAKLQEGEMRINGSLYNAHDLKRVSGYVMQDDLLFAHITVLETLQYAAELRLPADMSPEEKKNRVDEVINQLGLESCKNTVVGNAYIRGVSGGERKRVCVGIELLSNPKLLFLDEPTSGLDSATAFALCDTLKQLAARRNCTVITTIHQPQSKIFSLFDHLIVLNRGQIVYHGAADKVLEFYEKAGFPCPPLTNPADHILDVITPTRSSETQQAIENVKKLREVATPIPISFKTEESQPIAVDTKLVPWLRQFQVLLHRSFKEQYRNRRMIFTQFLQNIIMALLIGFAFYHIGDTQTSTVRRQPVLFFCAVNQGVFGALMLINSFPSEREIILRERASGSYKVSAYFLSKIIAEAAIQIVYPIVFSIMVYFIVGLHHSAGKFFIFMLFMILCNFAATSLALMISTIFRTTNMSVNVLPIALEIARLFGGFFLAPANLPKYFIWLDVCSYLKYTYVGIALNELEGLTLRCLDSQLVNGKCPITSGEQTIKTLGLDAYTIGECIGALILYIFLARTIAFFALKKIKW